MLFERTGRRFPVGSLLVAFMLIPVALLWPEALPPADAATVTVNVSNFTFTPATLTINAGDIVKWQWVEGTHTTTNGTDPSAPGAGTLWNAPLDAANTSFQRTFSTSGTFPYHCGFHFSLGMTGTITVLGGNAPPVVTNPGTQNGTEEAFFSVSVFASDPNNDPLTLTGTNIPVWASFVDNGDRSATVSGTPALGDAGTYNVTVTANDGKGGTDSETFAIVIASANIVVVNLTSSGFVPASVAITQGYKIRWIKDVGGNHTTTNGTGAGDPDAGLLWNAPLTAQNQQFTRQFDTVGSFPYFCQNHPTSETGTIVVNPQPTCSITGPAAVCSGSSGNVYSATVLPGGGVVTYAWSLSGNGSIVGGTTGSSVTVDAAASGSYTLTLDALRDGVPTQCTLPVTVNANPTCSILGPGSTCNGATGLVYTASVSPAGGTLTYSWSISGGGPSSARPRGLRPPLTRPRRGVSPSPWTSRATAARVRGPGS
jgi:plastocyanin